MHQTDGLDMGHLPRNISLIVTLLILVTWNQSLVAGQVYRWVDSEGTVHYGDSIPPEYSKRDRDVLNEHGIKIGMLPREPTQEEVAAAELAAEHAEVERLRAEELKERDSVLLNTYLSVEEIQALRDRRIELLDGRVRVTEIYLSSLQDKLAKLQKDASRFQPYNSDPDAPLIHDWLAKELANTLNSILVYDETLNNTRSQQEDMLAKFNTDIDRFVELTRVN
jgi:hypothetical protein